MMTKTQDLVIFLIMVLLHSAQSRNVRRNTDKTNTSRNPKLRNDYSHPNVEGCKDQGICSHVPNYPEDLAKSLLNDIKSKNETNLAREIVEGGDINYENICSDREKVIYPRAAKDINGTWKFILNGNSFQGFVVETCKKDCPEGTYISDYELKCTQKYVYKKMVYLDMEHRTYKQNNFQVPTCCSCSLLIRN